MARILHPHMTHPDNPDAAIQELAAPDRPLDLADVNPLTTHLNNSIFYQMIFKAIH